MTTKKLWLRTFVLGLAAVIVCVVYAMNVWWNSLERIARANSEELLLQVDSYLEIPNYDGTKIGERSTGCILFVQYENILTEDERYEHWPKTEKRAIVRINEEPNTATVSLARYGGVFSNPRVTAEEPR